MARALLIAACQASLALADAEFAQMLYVLAGVPAMAAIGALGWR